LCACPTTGASAQRKGRKTLSNTSSSTSRSWPIHGDQMMAAEYVQRSSTRIEALTGRVKGLRYAVRFDNFRLGNSFGLAAYLNNLEGLLREEVAPAN